MTAKRERPEDWIHGEKKSGKQYMLTKTAIATVKAIARQLELSESETMERIIRTGSFDPKIIGAYSPNPDSQ